MHLSRRSLMTAASVTLAASLAQSMPALAQSADEVAIAKAVEALRTAMLAADKAKLLELAADQLSYGHSSGKLETKAQYADAIASKKSVFKTLTFSEQTVAVTGNSAVVRNTFTSDVESEGKVTPTKIGVMQVWTKSGADWKLLARQAYKL
jgi:ketosteroid isomerase-like protein